MKISLFEKPWVARATGTVLAAGGLALGLFAAGEHHAAQAHVSSQQGYNFDGGDTIQVYHPYNLGLDREANPETPASIAGFSAGLMIVAGSFDGHQVDALHSRQTSTTSQE